MNTKIIRTPTRAEGGITAEEKMKMDVIAKEWIDIAMRTDPIEPDKIVPAIEALYAAANLKKPRVVIVPSPMVMAFAYGAAAWIWHCRKNPAAATDAATDDATYAATDDATYAATAAATDAATDDATYAATDDATDDATYAATRAATAAATRAATDDATDDAHGSPEKIAAKACKNMAGDGGLMCAKLWWRPSQGGNMWGAFPSYIAAMRDVLGLQLPAFVKYQAWEDSARHGSFRIMHEEFCMVSDFPKQIHKDAENRPHNDSGPSHEWRDGWKLYHIHGVRVPQLVVEHPEQITVQMIDEETNSEVRRIMIERYGQSRYLLDAGAIVLNRDDYGVLLRRDVPEDEPIVMVRVLNSTPEPDGSLTTEEAAEIFGADKVSSQATLMRALGHESPRWKDYFLRVPPEMKTAHEAVAWTFGVSADEYHPDFQS
ncbi:MAG: DUF6745 domain-containing protein [Acidithiobacillus sp.]